MQMDAKMVKSLVALGYMAKENELEIEDIVEMVERGFIALAPSKQATLF